ncbi:MAG: proteasome subunit alpha, partial [Nitrospirota bacterium]
MGMQGDFFQLLKEQGYQFGQPTAAGSGVDLPSATTILAFKYRDGVLVAGDRRATAGNMVM